MKIMIPDISKIITSILKVDSTFILEDEHPTLGSASQEQTIDWWRESYLKQISRNRRGKPVQIFNSFATNLLMRAIRGEVGIGIFQEMSKAFKSFEDITENRASDILKSLNYRWGAEKGAKVILGAKKVFLEKYQGNWERYFKEAETKHKENFLDDPFLSIQNVSFKVRDLALSSFSFLYSANDLHVIRVLARTGLLVYGYGNADIGTNPADEKNYIFLRNLMIKLSETSGYSPGELDRILWHFGRDICGAKPKCKECPLKNDCLTSLGIK